ncbi:MAG: excinuclease ABC subunit UvrC, partial [Clostridia bacterium]|nr:excinuclease ABC subunit UvrC [Clostridia bacterium]
GHRVEVRTPRRGASKYLCDMAVTDAAKHSENNAKRDRDDERTLAALASMLHLEVLPERIEAYDISNLGDEHITCGMAVAVDGKVKKSEYRTFTMKSKDTQDDYAAMTEALTRRLAHIGKPDDGMSAAPDLILLDGGRGHVSVIKELMVREGIEIPVFGMVKDEHHKTRTLVDEEGEINIARQADVFRLIYGIQEEVHRYSVSRMMGAKRRTVKTSTLEKIRGIGPAKAKALLAAFRTLAALKTADREAIAAVPGISAADADNVYLYFHSKPNNE